MWAVAAATLAAWKGSCCPPGLPSRTILDRTYSAQQFFIFSYFFLFILGCAVDKAGLTASFRAHVNIVSLLTYL